MESIALWQAILIGSWVGILRGGKFGYSNLIAQRPLVTALFVGIVLGRVPEALIIGASIQLIYMGLIAPGGNYAADDTVATVIGVTAGIVSGVNPQQAVVIALPVGIVSNYLTSIRYLFNSFFIHRADEHAKNGNVRGIKINATFFPFISGFLMYAIIVSIATYIGPEYIGQLVESLPQNIMHGLEVVGGVLPALGFALTIFVIGRKNMLIYFILGFFLTVALADLNINTIIYAIFGTTLAFIHINMKGNDSEGKVEYDG